VDILQITERTSAESEGHTSSEGVRPKLLQRIFSFPAMLASLLIVLAVLTVRARFDDPDLWWHLKTGEVIWTSHSIPLSDIFSYTTGHQSSVPQEWLAQLSIYGAYEWSGFSGLMVWLCAFSSILLIAGYCLCSMYSGNPKVAFAGAMLIWLFATIGFSIRPQLIGYLFLILELVLFDLGRKRNPRWFWGLPILFAVWVNCHGSFFLGLVVAGVLLFSSFFNFRSGSLVAHRWEPQCRGMLLLTLCLTVVALFLNPDGAKQILYPLNTILHQPVGLANSEEWQATQLTDGRGVALLAVLVCSLLITGMRRAELYWDEFLLLMLGTWLGVSHERTLFVFGILAAPILSRQLSNSWDSYNAAEDRAWPNAILIAVSVLVITLAFPSRQNLERQVEKTSPVKAVEFIKANHLSGPMINEYVFGGYLIWAAPKYPVFVDGRSDVYEWSGVLSQFGDWATLRSDPDALLQKYGVNFCLLAKNAPMARVLPLLTNWKMIYSDDNAVIFLRSSSGPGYDEKGAIPQTKRN
jgi:hypothetical protein